MTSEEIRLKRIKAIKRMITVTRIIKELNHLLDMPQTPQNRKELHECKTLMQLTLNRLKVEKRDFPYAG